MEHYEITITKGPLEGQIFKVQPGVNYIVGANAAGKTLFLEAIKAGSIRIDSPLKSNPGLNRAWQALEWGHGNEYDEAKGKKSFYHDLVTHMEEMGQVVPKKEEISLDRSKDVWIDEKQAYEIRTFAERAAVHYGERFASSSISQGTGDVFSRFKWKGDGQRYPKREGQNAVQHPLIFFLWDEPETHLHPSEQRKLSFRFNAWLKARQPRGAEQSKKEFVFATTHSPFALAGAEQFAHNVICLENCKVTRQALDGDNLTSLRVEANRMLGLGMDDVVPTKLLIAENSVVVLFDMLCAKFNWSYNDLAVTSGGDDRGINKAEQFDWFLKCVRLASKEWPHRDIFSMKISLVMDDKAAEARAKNTKVDDSIELAVSSIGNLELEDSYPPELVKEYLNSKSIDDSWVAEAGKFKDHLKGNGIKSSTDIGVIKSELANFVVSKLESVADFEKKMPEAYSVMCDLGIIKST